MNASAVDPAVDTAVTTSAVDTAVTTSVGVLVGVIAGCVWLFGNHALPRTVTLGVLTASVGLTATRLGQWAHTGATWANDLLGKLIGNLLGKPDVATPGQVLWAIGAIVLMIYLGFRFWQKDISNRTLIATALLPAAATTIPGAFGSLIYSALNIIATVIAWPITALLGW